jgi:hypothetical protein
MSGSTAHRASGLSFDPGEIYYFVNPHFPSTEPHYHICLEQAGGGVLFMSCCTSQFERRRQYIERAGLPMSTLVWLPPDDENKFKKETYVDCNSCFEFMINDLPQQDSFKYIGRIRPSHLLQIASGTMDSPRIEDYKKDTIQKLVDFLES